MSRLRSLLLCLTAWIGCAVAASPPPTDLSARVDFQQKLGASLPMSARFTDASGVTASLGHWMDGRPALLMLGYFRCPNLCDVSEQGMAHAIALSGLAPGRDVSVLFVSIDPRDRPADASAKQRMLAGIRGDANASDWHFLTGDAATLDTLGRAVGFHYFYDKRLDQYAHPAGLVIATADGRVNQYLMGVNYLPPTVRLAVAAASRHTLGHLVDRLVLFCCGYDPSTGRYTLTISHVMQALGVGFVATLLLLFALLRRRRPGTPS